MAADGAAAPTTTDGDDDITALSAIQSRAQPAAAEQQNQPHGSSTGRLDAMMREAIARSDRRLMSLHIPTSRYYDPRLMVNTRNGMDRALETEPTWIPSWSFQVVRDKPARQEHTVEYPPHRHHPQAMARFGGTRPPTGGGQAPAPPVPRSATRAVVEHSQSGSTGLAVTGTMRVLVQEGVVLAPEDNLGRYHFWEPSVESLLAPPHTGNIIVSGDGDDTGDDMPELVDSRKEN